MALLLGSQSPERVFALRQEIFRNNAVNYRWTNDEDRLLTQLILYSRFPSLFIVRSEHQKAYGEKATIPWLELAKKFNASPGRTQTRRPAHLQERWRNTLKLSFKRYLPIIER